MNTSKNILISGASGLIGSQLTDLLEQKGYTVSHLGRTRTTTVKKSFIWDIDNQFIEPDALQHVDTIIHLAGAGVVDKRWTKKRKQEILESRTKSSALLFSALSKGNHRVENFISASAIGIYGFEENESIMTENSSSGNDFLAQVTEAWEHEVDKIQALKIRVVKIRIGIVLSSEGGALAPMAKSVKLLVGAPLGSGTQYVSWIHIDDLCNIFVKAVEDKNMQGAYNGVAPHPVTNKELTTAIAKTLHKPLLIPSVPPFALKLLLGEMGDLVLKGSQVSCKKIEDAGYHFKFRTVEAALHDLLG
jgi:uncharacterized protein (TIGR01777 family)